MTTYCFPSKVRMRAKESRNILQLACKILQEIRLKFLLQDLTLENTIQRC